MMRGLEVALTLIALLLCGCGLRVPDIQEVGDASQGQVLVQAILSNITCELRDATVNLREKVGPTFIDGWGIQTTLTLTHDEKGAISPSVLWSPTGPPTNLFTLAAGINFAADATRTNKINGYYLVSDLERARCPDWARPNGPFLLQSDLKLTEWLFSAVSAVRSNTIDIDQTNKAVKENALQHEVKFEIVTGASANPSWKLKEVTVNPGADLFTVSRTRTHDLIITLAPAEKAVIAGIDGKGRTIRKVVARPIQQGAELHFSTLLADSIETGIRNSLQR